MQFANKTHRNATRRFHSVKAFEEWMDSIDGGRFVEILSVNAIGPDRGQILVTFSYEIGKEIEPAPVRKVRVF